MATIRSSAGSSSMRALSNVVLPLPVPPLTRIFRRVCNTRSASSPDVLGEGALFDQLRGRKRSLPKPPHGDGHVTGWPAEHRSPRASRRPGAHRGSASSPGPRPKGLAIWIAARSSAAAFNRGRIDWLCSWPWPSSHTLPGPLIMISLTSGSSSAASRPGKNGFSKSNPSPLIAARPVSRSSTGSVGREVVRLEVHPPGRE